MFFSGSRRLFAAERRKPEILVSNDAEKIDTTAAAAAAAAAATSTANAIRPAGSLPNIFPRCKKRGTSRGAQSSKGS